MKCKSDKECQTVIDSNVRHIWRHPETKGDCQISLQETVIPATFYQVNGTPVCPECGDDYEYLRAEICHLP